MLSYPRVFCLNYRLGFDPVKKLCEHRLHMLSDVAGYDDEEQVISWLQPSGLCFNNYAVDTRFFEYSSRREVSFSSFTATST